MHMHPTVIVYVYGTGPYAHGTVPYAYTWTIKQSHAYIRAWVAAAAAAQTVANYKPACKEI